MMCCVWCSFVLYFDFTSLLCYKQKTAYEMRISDWSSDVCSSDLIEQVAHVCQTTIVEDAWQRGQTVIVHGWVYGLHDGCLRDLDVNVASSAELAPARKAAVDAAFARSR